MKEGIHPKYEEAVITCACGNTFTTRSTKKEIHVEVCNKCHPFYTGQQRFVDTGGRVQRFADKFGAAKETVAEREAAKKAARAGSVELDHGRLPVVRHQRHLHQIGRAHV